MSNSTGSMVRAELGPDGWAAAKRVLLGEDGSKVSMKAAADAAGIGIAAMRRWIDRSRQKNMEDEPWVWEIADVIDVSAVAKAGVLEDTAWDRALNGVEQDVWHQGEVVGTKRVVDSRLLVTLLKAHDPKYIERTHTTNVNINADIDVNDLEARWLARERMKEINPELVRPLREDPITEEEKDEVKALVDSVADADDFDF